LWDQYQADFADFTEETLKSCNILSLRTLRHFLCDRGVWVLKDKSTTIARSLCNTLEEEEQHIWTKEEIAQHLTDRKTFIHSKMATPTQTFPQIPPQSTSLQPLQPTFQQPPLQPLQPTFLQPTFLQPTFQQLSSQPPQPTFQQSSSQPPQPTFQQPSLQSLQPSQPQSTAGPSDEFQPVGAPPSAF